MVVAISAEADIVAPLTAIRVRRQARAIAFWIRGAPPPSATRS